VYPAKAGGFGLQPPTLKHPYEHGIETCMEVKKVICIRCHNACRLAASVDGDRLISVVPDAEFPGAKTSNPISMGCPRRRAVVEYFYHPARLNDRMKRTGKRGENKWHAFLGNGCQGSPRSTWMVVSGGGGCGALVTRGLEVKLQCVDG